MVVDSPGSGSRRVKFRANQVQGEPSSRSISLPGVVPPARMLAEAARGGRIHVAPPAYIAGGSQPLSQSTDPTRIWLHAKLLYVDVLLYVILDYNQTATRSKMTYKQIYSDQTYIVVQYVAPQSLTMLHTSVIHAFIVGVITVRGCIQNIPDRRCENHNTHHKAYLPQSPSK
jgi:hypothetical protein